MAQRVIEPMLHEREPAEFLRHRRVVRIIRRQCLQDIGRTRIIRAQLQHMGQLDTGLAVPGVQGQHMAILHGGIGEVAAGQCRVAETEMESDTIHSRAWQHHGSRRVALLSISGDPRSAQFPPSGALAACSRRTAIGNSPNGRLRGCLRSLRLRDGGGAGLATERADRRPRPHAPARSAIRRRRPEGRRRALHSGNCEAGERFTGEPPGSTLPALSDPARSAMPAHHHRLAATTRSVDVTARISVRSSESRRSPKAASNPA